MAANFKDPGLPRFELERAFGPFGPSYITSDLAVALACSELESATDAVARLAGRLPPEEAALWCAQAVKEAFDQADRATDPKVAHALRDVGRRLALSLPPGKAATFCAPLAQAALDRVLKSADPAALEALVADLAGLAERLPRADGARLATAAARHLCGLMPRVPEASKVAVLVRSLAALADLLPRAEAEPLCGGAARKAFDLVRSLTATYPGCDDLILALGALAGRLSADDAARVCGPAARHALVLITNLKGAGKPWLPERARALAALTGRLPRDEAADLCGRAARHILALPLVPIDDAKGAVADALAVLAERLTPADAARAAGQLLDRLAAEDKAYRAALAKAVAALAGACDEAALVELLKHPFCVDEAGGLVRAALGKRLKQAFASHWELVAWLGRHRPDLDLRSPPRRPGP
jgi:hypothetical protein